jgi:hypothetical protein
MDDFGVKNVVLRPKMAAFERLLITILRCYLGPTPIKPHVGHYRACVPQGWPSILMVATIPQRVLLSYLRRKSRAVINVI